MSRVAQCYRYVRYVKVVIRIAVIKIFPLKSEQRSLLSVLLNSPEFRARVCMCVYKWTVAAMKVSGVIAEKKFFGMRLFVLVAACLTSTVKGAY